MWVTSTSGGSESAIDGEAVVLRGDGDLAGAQVLDRLVAAAVAELELEGLAAERVAEHLVAEADAEDRFFPDQLAELGVDVGERRGIAGAVGEENAVGVLRQHLGGGGGGGHHLHLEAVPGAGGAGC